tara:strand:- start:239 stop:1420 length:1182 start_codon:yes stop_codon:yes gene_type:complete
MKIAFLTAGGIAPCLSSSMGFLLKEYYDYDSETEFIGYLNGYKGLLKGDSIRLSYNDINVINSFGGSFIGNSRVKLTNVKDCVKNNYISKNEDPLEVAANQLINDNIDVLHTIGGDDTNTTAGDLVKYIEKKGHKIIVVGLPKTIDNDVIPIKQTLGAYTAAEQSAVFFENIVNENTTSSRQLIIHEVMGRNCGWLTAFSAFLYRKKLELKTFLPQLNLNKIKWDIHAIYIPEIDIDLDKESLRLKEIMNQYDCVNIFLSEGAGLDTIINEMKKNNEKIEYDAFGHVRIDEINPGMWFAKHFKDSLNADKVLVQKSGYFARSAAPNKTDLELIEKSANKAFECAINKESGVIGIHEISNKIECINFSEIKGGKKFDVKSNWFVELYEEINESI